MRKLEAAQKTMDDDVFFRETRTMWSALNVYENAPTQFRCFLGD